MKRLLFSAILAFAVLGFWLNSAEAGEKIRIAVVFPATIDDMSWCQGLHHGLVKVQEHMGKDKVEVSYSERLGNPVDASAAVRQYASQGYDIIIAHGTQYLSMLSDIAPDFPQTSFVYGAGFATPQPNIFAYDTHAEEGAYIMGVVSGMMTKSNILGVVGPIDVGDPAKFNKGFAQGAKSVNPKVDVRVAYTGSFNDVVGAGEIARAHMKAGADFLAGTSQQSVGAIKAASEVPGVRYMSSDLNPKDMAPDTVMGAHVYNFELVIRDIIDSRAKGELGGRSLPLNLANKAIRMEFNMPLPPDVAAKVEEVQNDIISGKLKINVSK